MSEAFSHKPETNTIESAPELPTSATDLKPENQPIDSEQQAEDMQTSARKAIEALPVGQAELALPVDDRKGNQPQYIDRIMQAMTLKTELNNIRQRLSLGQRVFSQVIHQPIIRTANEISGKTIARPSGLLGGGLCAFMGSLVYLLFTKYIGLEYNYLLSLIFFVGGFLLGIGIEFVARRLKQD